MSRQHCPKGFWPGNCKGFHTCSDFNALCHKVFWVTWGLRLPLPEVLAVLQLQESTTGMSQEIALQPQTGS